MSASEALTVPQIQVSFVIPARDEELLIGETLQHIHAAAQAVGCRYEIIVVDDGSKDTTAEIALQAGAKVIPVELHNIGAVRNAGAAEAVGEMLFFLDADTILPEETLRGAINAINNGATGGGCNVRFEPGLTWLQETCASIFIFFWLRMCRWAAGCSIFVKRDAFEQFGGFDPQYFAAEERFISEEIKKVGKFVILKEAVITSARKVRIYEFGHLCKVAFKVLFTGEKALKQRQGLEILYDAPREKQRHSVHK